MLALTLALLLSGCLVKPDYLSTTAVQPTVTPNGCEGCSCLVCERASQDPADTIAPGGMSPTFLSETGSGLRGGRCWFQPCGAALSKQLNDNQNQFQKPFMLGVGVKSWDSGGFVDAMKYCPMSDKYCAFASPGTTDRWQNVYRSFGGGDGWLASKKLLEENVLTNGNQPTIDQYRNIFLNLAPGIQPSDYLCLFTGSKTLSSSLVPGSEKAPNSLFCASGNCNKGRAYQSACRKDMNGNGLNYAEIDSNGFPVDETDCQCRTVRSYDPDGDLFFDTYGLTWSDPDETPPPSSTIIPSMPEWCHSPAANRVWADLTAHPNALLLSDYANPSDLPVYAKCSAPANPVEATCKAYQDVGTTRYCVEWEVNPGKTGDCAVNKEGKLELDEYGLCESCLPTMDLAPFEMSDMMNAPNYRTLLDMNILPVLNVQGWSFDPYLQDVANAVSKSASTSDGPIYPVIFVLDKFSYQYSTQIKNANPAYGGCKPIQDQIDDGTGTMVTIFKQSCLVAVEDDGSSQPIPQAYLADIDMLVREVTLGTASTCPSTAEVTQAITDSVARAKAVQSNPLYAGKKSIGWLLYAYLPNPDCAYAGLANPAFTGLPPDTRIFEALANAGYIGMIVPSVSGATPPYATIDTLLKPDDMLDFSGGATRDYNFFKFCGNYYTADKSRFFMRSEPKACTCAPCSFWETCDDTARVCGGPAATGGTGLECVSSANQLPMKPGTSGFKCASDCMPFPDTAAFDPNYVCSGTPASLAKDTENGCYAICNERLERDASTGDLKVVADPRGLVAPQAGYDDADAAGTTRFTPTNCYMKDTTGNFYVYSQLKTAPQINRAYPIFDAAGGTNACGLVQNNFIDLLIKQAAGGDMPSLVIKKA
ncbi:Uncharacterised protein [Candidatus Burarchaeum australiense]|nr:Uncharacterised protein [Candidatus Burarchaeum australiense]